MEDRREGDITLGTSPDAAARAAWNVAAQDVAAAAATGVPGTPVAGASGLRRIQQQRSYKIHTAAAPAEDRSRIAADNEGAVRARIRRSGVLGVSGLAQPDESPHSPIRRDA